MDAPARRTTGPGTTTGAPPTAATASGRCPARRGRRSRCRSRVPGAGSAEVGLDGGAQERDDVFVARGRVGFGAVEVGDPPIPAVTGHPAVGGGTDDRHRRWSATPRAGDCQKHLSDARESLVPTEPLGEVGGPPRHRPATLVGHSRPSSAPARTTPSRSAAAVRAPAGPDPPDTDGSPRARVPPGAWAGSPQPAG